MSRKDYILIADILKRQKEAEKMGWSFNIDTAFADYLESTNPQFSRERFLQACLIKE